MEFCKNNWICSIIELFVITKPYFLLLSASPSKVATANYPSPFGPIFCILLRHFNHRLALSHRIHKPPFTYSRFHLSWQFRLQHLSLNILVIIPRTRSNHLSLSSRVFSSERPTCAVPLILIRDPVLYGHSL